MALSTVSPAHSDRIIAARRQSSEGGHMKAQTSKPVVLHDGEGDATWFIGTLMTRKAGATDGVGGVAFLDQLAPAGFGPPLHVHHREDEGFYILEGQVDFVCDGQTFHLRDRKSTRLNSSH